VVGQSQEQADLTPGEASGTHCGGGWREWEGSRTSQDGFGKEKASPSSNWRVAIPTALTRVGCSEYKHENK